MGSLRWLAFLLSLVCTTVLANGEWNSTHFDPADVSKITLGYKSLDPGSKRAKRAIAFVSRLANALEAKDPVGTDDLWQFRSGLCLLGRSDDLNVIIADRVTLGTLLSDSTIEALRVTGRASAQVFASSNSEGEVTDRTTFVCGAKSLSRSGTHVHQALVNAGCVEISEWYNSIPLEQFGVNPYFLLGDAELKSCILRQHPSSFAGEPELVQYALTLFLDRSIPRP